MTELIWEGKYDADGRKVAPLRVALPFQTVETVNESAQERQRALDLWGSGRDSEWRNRLIWGDKKYVLPSLLEEFAGKLDLIYIDPPFDTGADFSFQVSVDGEGFFKEPNLIEMKAYRDTWGRGLDSYIASGTRSCGGTTTRCRATCATFRRTMMSSSSTQRAPSMNSNGSRNLARSRGVSSVAGRRSYCRPQGCRRPNGRRSRRRPLLSALRRNRARLGIQDQGKPGELKSRPRSNIGNDEISEQA